MNDAEAQIAGLVATLAVRFANRTLAELPSMRAELAQVGGGNEAALQTLRKWAHKVRGTAASLGLSEVGAQASLIEGALPESAHTTVAPAALECVAEKLNCMEALLNACAAPGERQ